MPLCCTPQTPDLSVLWVGGRYSSLHWPCKIVTKKLSSAQVSACLHTVISTILLTHAWWFPGNLSILLAHSHFQQPLHLSCTNCSNYNLLTVLLQVICQHATNQHGHALDIIQELQLNQSVIQKLLIYALQMIPWYIFLKDDPAELFTSLVVTVSLRDNHFLYNQDNHLNNQLLGSAQQPSLILRPESGRRKSLVSIVVNALNYNQNTCEEWDANVIEWGWLSFLVLFLSYLQLEIKACVWV